MRQDEFEPKMAIREERRGANEALGRSFCKTLAELITNSDSSGKRKHRIAQSSGLLDLMFQIPKGNQLDTASLKNRLEGRSPRRKIVVEVVGAKRQGRQPREIVVIDQAQGMSGNELKTALEDIGGDRTALANGMVGRNLFGRGLSDVMRAHHEGAVVYTFNGHQVSRARGEWSPRWKIIREIEDNPKPKDFKPFLSTESTGTAVRFVASKKGFRIPDPDYINQRLANFYMLRLIAADPNVALVLQQYRTREQQPERITYDFPIGQVVESFSREFAYATGTHPLRVEVLLVRADRKLLGLGQDRDARENGLLIVDDLDAVYDLTFADPDFERAEFLRQMFGVVRVHGLRQVLEDHLNSLDDPTSPLRVDRDGFNPDHPFARKLLEFLAAELRPCYERERKRTEETEHNKLSVETQKRIDDALKLLNRYFQEITERAGRGLGTTASPEPEPPSEVVAFVPRTTQLTVGRQRQVFLLVRDDAVRDGCEVVVADAPEEVTVQPRFTKIYKGTTLRWRPHPNFFCLPFLVTGHVVGTVGTVKVLVESIGGEDLAAHLEIANVLEEPTIVPPETMEFRPYVATGRPNRRNSLILYVNTQVISTGHCVHFRITKRTGGVELIDETGGGVEQLNVKLNEERHGVPAQPLFRVRVPWRGTAWSQHAYVEARVKIGPEPYVAIGRIRLDEPDPQEGGFFQRIEYDELDNMVPSMFAAGVITVNMQDPLNKLVFGTGETKDEARREFDRRLSRDPKAQQRLVTLLLEEMSFRALQELFSDNKLPLPSGREIAAIHDEIDKHKFKQAVELYKLLVK